ncbi:hypothetical protein FQZ97_1028160 [compost metagenome]
MSGLGDQHALAGLDLRQFDQGEPGAQQAGVVHRGLVGAEHGRVAGQRGAWHQHHVAPRRIAVRRVRREAGHGHAGLQVGDAVADGLDDTGQFVAQAGGQRGLVRGEVLPPEHVAPKHAQRLHAHQHFARPRLRGRHFLEPEHRGVTELVETDHAGHHIPRLCMAL